MSSSTEEVVVSIAEGSAGGFELPSEMRTVDSEVERRARECFVELKKRDPEKRNHVSDASFFSLPPSVVPSFRTHPFSPPNPQNLFTPSKPSTTTPSTNPTPLLTTLKLPVFCPPLHVTTSPSSPSFQKSKIGAKFGKVKSEVGER